MDIATLSYIKLIHETETLQIMKSIYLFPLYSASLSTELAYTEWEERYHQSFFKLLLLFFSCNKEQHCNTDVWWKSKTTSNQKLQPWESKLKKLAWGWQLLLPVLAEWAYHLTLKHLTNQNISKNGWQQLFQQYLQRQEHIKSQ